MPKHDVRFLPLENPLLVNLSALYNIVHGAFSSPDDLYLRNSLYKQNSQHVTSVAVVLRSNPSLTHFFLPALPAGSGQSDPAVGAARGGLLTHPTGYTFKCLCLKFVEKARRETHVTAYFPCAAPQQPAPACHSHTLLHVRLESKFAGQQMKMSNTRRVAVTLPKPGKWH